MLQVCAAYCADNSSRNKYYATQYGEECWCSASVDLRHGKGTCDYACTGAPGTTCGGFDAFDLFELERVDVPSPPSEDYYLGCFADDQHDRVLQDKMSSDDMTLQVSLFPLGAGANNAPHCVCWPTRYCSVRGKAV